MRVIALYHPKSDHEGQILDYARDYKRFKTKELELVSLETIEGAELAKLYDVTRYPAILALRDDGHLQSVWQGDKLPLLDELGYSAQN